MRAFERARARGALAPGRYIATIVVTDRANYRSRPATVSFTVK